MMAVDQMSPIEREGYEAYVALFDRRLAISPINDPRVADPLHVQGREPMFTVRQRYGLKRLARLIVNLMAVGFIIVVALVILGSQRS